MSTIKIPLMRKLRLLFPMLMLTFLVFGQQKTITGTVSSQTTKEPLQGVSVQAKNKAVITDANGKFSIEASEGETVTLSFVGMKSLNLKVTPTTQHVVLNMEDGQSDLEQIVVTGYQTQRKVDLTGAVSVVNLEETKNIPAASPMQALQGRVPGLYVETDGSPAGGTRRILVRGLNTLGNSDPLYVIDGVPTKSSVVFTSLNPNSIASIQILKDASASSIYGARASNGVIIVTTKEGKSSGGQEKVSIQLNSSISVQTEKPWREDVLTAEERGRVLWQAAVNDRTDPSVHKAIYTYDWNGDFNKPALNKVNIVPFVGGEPLQPVGNTNWQEAAYDPAIIHSHDLTISSGTAKTGMLINLAYYKNTGMLAFTNYERYTARINSHTTLFDGKLRVGENFQVSRSTEKLASNDLGGASVPDLAVTLAPTIPVFRTDGAYAGPIGAGYSDRNNPVNMQYVNRWDKTNRLLLFGNVYAELELVKNLRLRTSFGADYSTTLFKNIDPAFQEGFLGRSVNSLSLNESNLLSLTWTNTLNYQIEFGNHRLNALLGTEAIREDLQTLGAFREGFAVEDENYYFLNAGTGRSTNEGTSTGYRLFSTFAKLNYSFSDRYLASATVRRDGSSRFGTENQYGVFPAFTLGWRINNEDFFSGIDVVSDLKLRAGVGRVGNQEIGNLARFGLYQTNYGPINGRLAPTDFPGSWLNIGTAYDLNGVNQGTLPSGYVSVQGENQNLRWESTEELNVGLDFGFLAGKITGSFDYFVRETKDILIQPPVAGAVGEGRVRWLNGATKDNKGWEAVLTYQNATSGGLNYGFTGTAAHFRDEITILPPEVRTAYQGTATNSVIGHSQLDIFGYKYDGIFQNEAEVTAHAVQTGKGIGRIRYKDLNGDGTINATDRDWIGTQLPTLEYGLRIDLDYKNIDLSIFGSGVAGKEGFDPMGDLNKFVFVNSNNGKGLLNAWTPENPTNVPRASLVNRNDEFRQSDFRQVNAAYFKLRNVQLGYTLQQSGIQRLKMAALRFYLVGQNLLAIKDKEFTAKDPERVGGLGNWAQPTTVTFGLNVTF